MHRISLDYDLDRIDSEGCEYCRLALCLHGFSAGAILRRDIDVATPKLAGSDEDRARPAIVQGTDFGRVFLESRKNQLKLVT